MNVLPVERRNERAVEPIHDLVGDLIGLVLEPLERLDEGRAPFGRRGEQLAQVVGRFLLRLATSTNRSKNSSSRGSRRTKFLSVEDGGAGEYGDLRRERLG